ncbi:MAG: hypothetical protein C0444_03755 [Microbacterium sp.]|nr:hypothetical protein [Microbacterium sp.]MBA4345265.1 hypothetical protein [Microbacterium sp.]
MSPIDDDEVALVALRAADPAGNVVADAATRRSAVRAAMASSNNRSRWSKTWAVIIVAIGAAVVIPVGASATGFAAFTGWFGSPNPPETVIEESGSTRSSSEADSSEWLDVLSDDFIEAATQLMPPYITLPEGTDRQQFARVVAESMRNATVTGPDAETVGEFGALMQTTGVVATYELHAQCAWRAEWIDAFDNSEQQRTELATQALTNSATWPATVATDGGGVVANEQRLAAAAEAGDRTTVATEGLRNCPAVAFSAGR